MLIKDNESENFISVQMATGVQEWRNKETQESESRALSLPELALSQLSSESESSDKVINLWALLFAALPEDRRQAVTGCQRPAAGLSLSRSAGPCSALWPSPSITYSL
ncbi:hypothetical protein SRHO_G00226060 [Serrasalmus rhombeus]